MNLLLCDLVSIFSVTVAALSSIVLILIGWDIYHFIYARNWVKKIAQKEAKKISDKITSESAHDLQMFMFHMRYVQMSQEYYVRGDKATAIDDIYEALNALLQCKNPKYVISFAPLNLTFLGTLFQQSPDKKAIHLLEGKQDEYESVLRRLHAKPFHLDVPDIPKDSIFDIVQKTSR